MLLLIYYWIRSIAQCTLFLGKLAENKSNNSVKFILTDWLYAGCMYTYQWLNWIWGYSDTPCSTAYAINMFTG